LWNRQIAKGDVTVYNAAVNNIQVIKGQKIFFRLQSGNQEMSNGAFDYVEWSPTVKYIVDIDHQEKINPDGQSTITFPASEGIVMSDLSGASLPEVVPVTVSGTFVKPITSDSITLRIMLSNDKENEDGKAFAGNKDKRKRRR